MTFRVKIPRPLRSRLAGTLFDAQRLFMKDPGLIGLFIFNRRESGNGPQKQAPVPCAFSCGST